MESLWYSLKHTRLQHVQDAALAELRQAVNRYFIDYNSDRPHSSLGYRYPNAVYKEGIDSVAEAL